METKQNAQQVSYVEPEEHYTSIDLTREEHHTHADCGCALIATDGVVRLYHCPLHDAAPALLEACRAMTNSLRTFRNVPQDAQQWTSLDDDAIDAGFAAIAQAVQP